MAYSSILGADSAPSQPSGRDADLLGPSDNTDSGSDTVGTHEAHADSDSRGTGESGAAVPGDMNQKEGADILPDHVVRLGEGGGFSEADPDAQEFTDLDADADGRSSPSSDEDEESGR
jgi:hypothetical protein